MNGIRRWVWALGVLSVLPLSMPIAAAVDGARVQMAIAKGAEFLRKTHTPAPGYTGGTHGLGQSALAGIALLEAGVSPKDPSLQQIAQFVRIRGLSENRTYHLSLSIIFLDLLHDTHDHGLIQVMGIRLYHGLNVAGGWTYEAWDNIPETEARRLAAVLYPPRKTAAQPELRTPAASGFPAAPPRAATENPPARLHPEAARQLQAVRNAMTVTGRRGVGDDNSNTQFGIIGLWVATRHGLAVDDAFALIETRFLRSQNPTDGGWAYSGTGASTPAMTCAGLLGLAVGVVI
ncbi:MAG: hypothetical protein LC104_08070 [Bacteroidales bacterium]|nr:hypothetical protein [Bacteroidales bacterium]